MSPGPLGGDACGVQVDEGTLCVNMSCPPTVVQPSLPGESCDPDWLSQPASQPWEKSWMTDLVNSGWFFERYHQVIGGYLFRTNLTTLLRFIINDRQVTCIRWIAYMLATAYWETPAGNRFAPREEEGTEEQLGKKYAKVNGNEGKEDGYKYRGRGYVQLTGKANYKEMGKDGKNIVSEDLLADPDKVTIPANAYKIMSYGMRANGFCKKGGLGKFLGPMDLWGNRNVGELLTRGGPGWQDYVDAREIINADVKKNGDAIACCARMFEAILR